MECRDVNVEEISIKRVQGYHLKPIKKSYSGILLTFGGSEGSSWLSMAFDLAKKGFEVLSLYYFGKSNLQSRLDRVDVGFIDDVFEYINNSGLGGSLVTIIAASRGTELGLLIANYYNPKCNLFLFSPSAYVFTGVSRYSAWVINGKELPYITFSKKTLLYRLLNRKQPIVKMFQKELSLRKNCLDYLIDISNIQGKIVLFSGRDDQIWPSSYMSGEIHARMREFQHCEMYEFMNAGHSFHNSFFDGGTFDGNLYAFYKSQEIIFQKLSDWHLKE